MGWGVGVCQQQAGQLDCVVLTLQEGGTRICPVLPIILGPILLREAEEVAQHTDGFSKDRETGQLISLNRVMGSNWQGQPTRLVLGSGSLENLWEEKTNKKRQWLWLSGRVLAFCERGSRFSPQS